MDSFTARTEQFIIVMVLACRGEVKAQQDISHLIGQMMVDPTLATLCQSLLQIIVGERDREQLTQHLEGEPALLVRRILAELENKP